MPASDESADALWQCVAPDVVGKIPADRNVAASVRAHLFGHLSGALGQANEPTLDAGTDGAVAHGATKNGWHGPSADHLAKQLIGHCATQGARSSRQQAAHLTGPVHDEVSRECLVGPAVDRVAVNGRLLHQLGMRHIADGLLGELLGVVCCVTIGHASTLGGAVRGCGPRGGGGGLGQFGGSCNVAGCGCRLRHLGQIRRLGDETPPARQRGRKQE